MSLSSNTLLDTLTITGQFKCTTNCTHIATGQFKCITSCTRTMIVNLNV